ncbi:MAG: hypothetical protein COW00_17195 [Bdellovibrio sp. CG12_big_fil_rev_8_21_14_0_65_39_13]|nr:MAG: hypothetical protein COW78_00365 [Bdellovibrio sp. CG22_combo_CG10-13_8_21_14_all_39_27]PIQ58171.1 MAG: hypothetical protein COW00_17195 [Bdellovibrio sp. CG12_big_fil_rev_8_21_14_0_65_39_13]PIR34333.1 MAG: hypothetical protein COV37_13435 [Bdellovibrio sp. CG11_big_fil_rev_8_21_14_0_20_39_38]PJB52232.1 MAG: hypothetical protein CO099_13740 [Bdellovibrio sp. CG_4_9_14_3_um_filter_39_7]
MRSELKDLALPVIKTLIILIVLEVFSTSILPVLGLVKYRIPFNIMIVLYLGFKLNVSYLAVLILFYQYVHSLFSTEGWEMGTLVGIIISIVISYLRDLIHFRSSAVTIFVTQLFQVLWFFLISGLIYMKTDQWTYVLEKFWRFVPESLFISFVAPFFFFILDRVWNVKEDGILGER